jgi:hypothetical protein
LLQRTRLAGGCIISDRTTPRDPGIYRAVTGIDVARAPVPLQLQNAITIFFNMLPIVKFGFFHRLPQRFEGFGMSRPVAQNKKIISPALALCHVVTQTS